MIIHIALALSALGFVSLSVRLATRSALIGRLVPALAGKGGGTGLAAWGTGWRSTVDVGSTEAVRLEGTGAARKLILREGAAIHLVPGWVRGDAKWRVLYPLGAPITRLLHGTYLTWLFRSGSGERSLDLPTLDGAGGFAIVHLLPGERIAIKGKYLAGFSDTISRLNTEFRILSVPGLMLRVPLFVGAEGPGALLLYAPTGIVESSANRFDPTRLVAWRLGAKMMPMLPKYDGCVQTVAHTVLSPVDVEIEAGDRCLLTGTAGPPRRVGLSFLFHGLVDILLHFGF